MFRQILLAADGSKHSVRATEKALFLSKKIVNSKITLIHVVDALPGRSDVMDENFELSKGIPEHRTERTGKIEEMIRKAEVNLEVKHIFGEPGPSIVREANEGNYDLVVIGSRGLNPFQQLVLGSVSHKVAKRVTCPVLIVK
ncbi:universal stress protein [Evansella sp. AB-rgal1]|uniref:universal stress protein n=1 Tax=Evansella sp. AB-rgal1 TaxID=3242696 RepID=UPI00359D3B3C